MNQPRVDRLDEPSPSSAPGSLPGPPFLQEWRGTDCNLERATKVAPTNLASRASDRVAPFALCWQSPARFIGPNQSGDRGR